MSLKIWFKLRWQLFVIQFRRCFISKQNRNKPPEPGIVEIELLEIVDEETEAESNGEISIDLED